MMNFDIAIGQGSTAVTSASVASRNQAVVDSYKNENEKINTATEKESNKLAEDKSIASLYASEDGDTVAISKDAVYASKIKDEDSNKVSVKNQDEDSKRVNEGDSDEDSLTSGFREINQKANDHAKEVRNQQFELLMSSTDDEDEGDVSPLAGYSSLQLAEFYRDNRISLVDYQAATRNKEEARNIDNAESNSDKQRRVQEEGQLWDYQLLA